MAKPGTTFYNELIWQEKVILAIDMRTIAKEEASLAATLAAIPSDDEFDNLLRQQKSKGAK